MPYKSDKQRRYFHAKAKNSKVWAERAAHWDAVSKSAFGVEHAPLGANPYRVDADHPGLYQSDEQSTDLHKARRGPGYTGPHDPASSMTQRKGPGYEKPTAEQIAGSVNRRKAQAQYKAEKPFRRVGAGAKVPWQVHRKAAGKSPEVFVPIIAGTAIASYALHHRTQGEKKPVAKALTKEQKDKAGNYALGSAAGTGVGATVMQGGGQAAKITMKNRRAKRGISPHEEQVWAAHKAKYGNKGGNGKNAWKAYAKYPKELADWRGQRALAFKNRPAVSIGIVGAGTAAGAAYAHHRNKRLS